MRYLKGNNILNFILKIKALTRVFPYNRYLITLLPFFASMMHFGMISSPISFMLVVPFITAMAAGFVYNGICDAEKDPNEKNIITRGEVTKYNAYIIFTVLIIISIYIFSLVYTSKIALIIFIIYILLWLVYSGLEIRFKETYLGVIIASLVLWTGAPFIILLEFYYFNSSLGFLLLGLFLIYIGFEIRHTITDYEMDLEYNCKTFTVRCGKKRATIIENITLILGNFFLLSSIYLLNENLSTIFTIIFAVLFLISIALKIYNFDMFPYFISKLFIITYSCIVLQLPILIIFFVVWIGVS